MKKLGVYIHIPFCQKKCNYCDFVSFAKNEEIQEKYINSLIQEIRIFKQENKDFRIQTIYIGGGTPSFINSRHIENVLRELLNEEKKGNVLKKDITEITIEVNPGTVTKEKLEVYKNIGINRLSIGLQSTNDNILKTIGRIHNLQNFLDTFNLAKKVGFENINIDLMIGLPDQKLDDVKDMIKKVVKLNPKHISVYSLIIEENTPIFEMINKGEIKLPGEELERDMYWYVKNYLEQNRYHHYEISNFAKNGYESKHNVDCWDQKEYIGFGLASHSYIDGVRFSNTTNLDEYINFTKKEEFEKSRIIQEIQTKYMKEQEYMLLGLRKVDGVSVKNFTNKFNESPTVIFEKELKKLLEEELICINKNEIKLTNKGLDLANLVWQEFC